MRRRTKRLAESFLGRPSNARRLAHRLAPGSLVLAFHNVIPDREGPRGDQSLHVTLSRFGEILDGLSELFDVVPVSEVYDTVSFPGDRPRAAITFDDAYAGAVALAVPEVARRGLPATIFAISSARDGQTFWWDALGDPAGGLATGMREEALTAGQGREVTVRALAAERGWPVAVLGGPFVAATWQDLAEAARQPGIEVAHHTRTHPNAAILDRAALVQELGGGRKELERRIPNVRPWLAWPYGRSSAAARAVAMEAGFELAFRVDGGAWMSSDPPPPRFRLPRLNVPAGLTVEGFRLRAVGLLGR